MEGDTHDRKGHYICLRDGRDVTPLVKSHLYKDLRCEAARQKPWQKVRQLQHFACAGLCPSAAMAQALGIRTSVASSCSTCAILFSLAPVVCSQFAPHWDFAPQDLLRRPHYMSQVLLHSLLVPWAPHGFPPCVGFGDFSESCRRSASLRYRYSDEF